MKLCSYTNTGALFFVSSPRGAGRTAEWPILCRYTVSSVTRPKIRSCWKQDGSNVVGVTLFTVFNNIVRHCYTWLQANSGAILLPTRNNVTPKTPPLHPVYNNLLQLIIFRRVIWTVWWFDGLQDINIMVLNTFSTSPNFLIFFMI